MDKTVKNEQIVLFTMKTAKYSTSLNSLTKTVANHSKYFCFISMNKPYKNLSETFSKLKIDSKKILFVDCVSGSVKKEKGFDVIFVSSPKALTELDIKINEALGKNVDACVFDSLSTILVYEDPSTVVKFVHSVIAKARIKNRKMFFTILKEDTQSSLIKDIGMFVDKIVAV